MIQDIEIFDKQAALKRMEGDEELLQDMVEIFLEDFPNQMNDIGVAIDTNDAEKLVNAAHALKGSVGNFGAKRTFEAAQKLEGLAKDNAIHDWQDAWSCLQSEMSTLEPVLSDVLA